MLGCSPLKVERRGLLRYVLPIGFWLFAFGLYHLTYAVVDPWGSELKSVVFTAIMCTSIGVLIGARAERKAAARAQPTASKSASNRLSAPKARLRVQDRRDA